MDFPCVRCCQLFRAVEAFKIVPWVVVNLIEWQQWLLIPLSYHGISCVFIGRTNSNIPFIVTLTPDAKNKPPNRLLKIWLPSSVAVAWFVISIPEVKFTNSRYIITLQFLNLYVMHTFESLRITFFTVNSPLSFKRRNATTDGS